MPMELDFRGRVNNTKVPNGSGLDTVFEAVVNSIQAMDPECQNPRIDITPTSCQNTFDGSVSSFVTGFIIWDNGVGFTDENYKSFRKVDSPHKFDLGCKGIGRLSWLKVFSDVSVDSVFIQNSVKYRRQFSFNLDSDGVYGGDHLEETDLPVGTTIKLEHCLPQYQKSIQFTPKTIASKIFDHCLAYFLHGEKHPIIRVLGSEEPEIVNDIYDSIKDRIVYDNSTEIAGHHFDVYHVRFHTLTGFNGISFCANNLHVKNIEKIDRSLVDSDGQEFRYVCFVYSSLLDNHVNASRDDFDLGKDSRLITDLESPSIKEIMDVIRPKCDEFLKPYSAAYQKRCFNRLKQFTESDAGKMFTAVVKYDPKLISEIKPDMKDTEIFQKCSESQSRLESEIIFDPKRIKGNPIDDSSAVEEHYLKVKDLQKDQLTRLITHRGLILSIYDERLEAIKTEFINDKVKFEYELESVIHDLILPRGTDRKKRATLETCNLWIIDERLEYYAYYGAYSDKRLCDISENESKLRPDVFIFGDVTEEMEAKSICIIEFKRPNRKDRDIINQIYDYIDAMRHSKIPNYRGEAVSITNNTIFYCYAICNTIDDEIKTLANRNQMKPQFGDRGYFVWNGEYSCSMDLIDHHKVFSDAKMRNKIFFSTIGLDVSSDLIRVQKGPPIKVDLNPEE